MLLWLVCKRIITFGLSFLYLSAALLSAIKAETGQVVMSFPSAELDFRILEMKGIEAYFKIMWDRRKFQ